MNPFDHPEIAVDIIEIIENCHGNIEIFFKEFFYKQIMEEINKKKSINNLKIYKVNRYQNCKNIEIIQAYTNAHAAYLFLLYETKLSNCYPFIEKLRCCQGLGLLTPYDIYLLVIHNIFDDDIEFNDYLEKADQLIILCP